MSSMNLERLAVPFLSGCFAYLLFKEAFKFLSDLLADSVHYFGHSSCHGIPRPVPICASNAHNFVIGEAFDIAERSITL